jgi:hypothetical protein
MKKKILLSVLCAGLILNSTTVHAAGVPYTAGCYSPTPVNCSGLSTEDCSQDEALYQIATSQFNQCVSVAETAAQADCISSVQQPFCSGNPANDLNNPNCYCPTEGRNITCSVTQTAQATYQNNLAACPTNAQAEVQCELNTPPHAKGISEIDNGACVLTDGCMSGYYTTVSGTCAPEPGTTSAQSPTSVSTQLTATTTISQPIATLAPTATATVPVAQISTTQTLKARNAIVATPQSPPIQTAVTAITIASENPSTSTNSIPASKQGFWEKIWSVFYRFIFRT